MWGRVSSVRSVQVLRSLVPRLAIPHVPDGLWSYTVPLRYLDGARLVV